jgi:MFS family permease
MSLIFLAGLTPFGYGFLGVIALSILIAYMWLKSSGKKEKMGCFSIGFTAFVIWFALMFPVAISFSIIENGTKITQLGVAIFWFLLFALGAYIIFSKNRTGVKKVLLGIFKYVLFSIVLGLFLTMLGGLAYFVYLRLFTHEKDDSPIWVALLCIFFLASLILAAVGLFIQSKEGKKKEKTTFYKLEEAKLKPDMVVELNLTNAKLDAFPVAILQFKNIKFLVLSNNNISEIPNEVNKLQQLIGLDLSNNPVSDLERNKIRKLLSNQVEIMF